MLGGTHLFGVYHLFLYTVAIFYLFVCIAVCVMNGCAGGDDSLMPIHTS